MGFCAGAKQPGSQGKAGIDSGLAPFGVGYRGFVALG